MKFKGQVKKFSDKVKEKALNTFKGTALSMFGHIVSRTPVGNPDYWENPNSAPEDYTGGRLKSNWQCDVNAIPSGVIDDIDETGDDAKNRALYATARAAIGDKIYIINNLPYAIPIEYGHSAEQAPKGMVRVTIKEFKNIVKEAARK